MPFEGLHRVNFLDEQRGRFTYRNMLVIMAVWCGILFLVLGFLWIRELMLFEKLDDAKEGIKLLNDQKEQFIKVVEVASKKQVGTTAQDDLAQILTDRPLWSNVLGLLTRALPSHVWLSAISVAKDKDQIPKVDIKGKTKSQRALTDYVIKLETSGKFRGAQILQTKLGDGNVFDFEMEIYPLLDKF